MYKNNFYNIKLMNNGYGRLCFELQKNKRKEYKNMFEVMSQMMIQLVQILPFIIPLILVLNLCAYLLWGGK